MGNGQSANGKDQTIVLTTRVDGDNKEAGEDRYNENTVKRADVFFFNADQTGECIYAQTGLQADEENKLNVTLDYDIIHEGSSYYIYVIANHDLGYTNDTAKGKTLAELKAAKVTTEWKADLDLSGTNAEKESSLLMDGGNTITISRTTPGTVELTRAMAKVVLFPTVEKDEIVVGEGDDAITYKPVRNKMNVTMVYGVKSTQLDGQYAVQESDYITRLKRTYTPKADEPETTTNYEHVPFYSYPNPETTVGRQDSYLILCVPWSAVSADGTSQQAVNYYYRVPITGDDSPATLLRNRYYKINVNVGVLGSLDPKDAIELKANFLIMDWSTMEISTEMQNYQYLVLDEYHSVMNNVDELEMPYISSSNIDWNKTKVTQVTYMDYHKTNAYQVTLNADYTQDRNNSNRPVTFSEFKVSEGNKENTIKLTHPLDANDHVPYIITVEVYNLDGIHTDTWTIEQYPAMYIVGESNDSGDNNRFVYGISRSNGNPQDDNRTSLGGVYNPFTTDATNSNKNQYTIYITSFDVDDKYAIGDPRSEEVDNLLYLQDKADNNGKHLTYYYPTIKENVEDIENYGSTVAPAFKIASSWGVVDGNGISYETAQRRCASYQENGYPAGRWRIPTEGEIEYIVGLSDAKKIPALFNGDYFASSGRYYDNGYKGGRKGFHSDNNKHSVRCVYDVWYWGNDKIQNPNQFTWGDEERQ